MSLQLVDKTASFGGTVERFRHASTATGTEMRFSVFRPPQAATERLPVLYWLSGLTCTEENFMQKAGAQRLAAEKGLLLVAPDTSPRDTGIPGETGSWDFGAGAGFYVDATREPWAKHYKMESYVVAELPRLVHGNFPTRPDRESIFGHSMGGHGALTLSLRHPDRYRSVSAFAPIANPTKCPWGRKAFTGYLGEDQTTWAEHDATLLVGRSRRHVPFLVDQGLDDKFLKDQLMPEALEEACRKADYPLELRRRAGYDHSYYFIASFVDEHLEHHARALLG